MGRTCFTPSSSNRQNTTGLLTQSDFNDIFAQGTTSGGVPIPNPDTILEFKVQTETV